MKRMPASWPLYRVIEDDAEPWIASSSAAQ